MKNQILSIEQMQHLQELGVDTSKASCYWWYAEGKNYLYFGKCSDINGIPTFTLQDMLEMVKEVFTIHIHIYQDEIFLSLQKIEGFVEFDHSSNYLIECVYEALCWCAKNGYLKGGKKWK